MDYDEVILQVDFAEHYCAAHKDEIQSAYWSHKQITVFTACAWLKDAVRSFAIVSDDLSHDKYQNTFKSEPHPCKVFKFLTSDVYSDSESDEAEMLP